MNKVEIKIGNTQKTVTIVSRNSKNQSLKMIQKWTKELLMQ